MLTLGMAGGLDPAHDQVLDDPQNYTYDGGAVLVRGGEVVFAAEEERLNRIKHSNKFPVRSLRYCLTEAGVKPGEVDRFAYYVDETAANALLSRLYLARPEWPLRADARTMLAGALSMALGCEITGDRVAFYPHKLTHAASAAVHGGAETSLVYVVDSASGLFESSWDDDGRLRLSELTAMPPARSMNLLWERTLPLLGLGLFDEHKAVAMAAHGDPSAFESVFARVCRLLPDGEYALDLSALGALVGEVAPRMRGEPPGPAHVNLAAALQRATEEVVLHVAAHYRDRTGQRILCLAGGMIENTGVAGRLLRSGLFDEVFVHPSAYDSGCAVGAALLAANDRGQRLRRGRVEHVYWGTDIGGPDQVAAALAPWSGLVDARREDDVAARAAELLAGGEVVGWVQGRAEFGSHPLGNRSVLADPREAAAATRVAKLTGRGDTYRPFAASVPEERAEEIAELPAGPTPFLTFAVELRSGAGAPAVTQVDGTARLHTVSRAVNPRFWALLTEFGRRTGVPVLLNTSCNTANEPTADSVDDAVATLLTSGLDWFVIGDFLVRRTDATAAAWRDLVVRLPEHIKLFRVRGKTERDAGTARHEIRTACDPPLRRAVTPELAALIDRLDQPMTVGELLGDSDEQLAPLRELWAERLVHLSPRRMS